MEKDNLEKGLAKRKEVLGPEYVTNMFEQADDFTKPFQEAMTAWCWGFGWSDDTIDAKTRSMMNLTMIAALNRMHEWKLHCKGAITNGVSREELKAIIHAIGIYCGVPAAVECFRIVKEIDAENERP